ncbi:mandelate racemase/muconate lactonizing enzyme family protein [uncultured Algibacter sp.]|uniref:mandelate racemase/muconate lactonizing enzyme family protein n=1 Tax=uncultured Algibacter sp. TaxID=298659 RepID=UPI0026297CAB|nr:mandelate racemase/muconate lactonizing enzyme family protein [uncultured Algibacter sp.]
MSKVKKVEAFSLTIPRDKPYLGDAKKGEEANKKGYFVREGNKTVYATVDRTIIVRIETHSGVVGWGETYGLIAPEATMALINDFMSDFVEDKDPFDVSVIYEDIYNMMRFRKYSGGYYHDALAAIDIALWDICGKIAGLPISKLLGGQRRKEIPAYVSGLPEPTLEKRVQLALSWKNKGFHSFKFATPQAADNLNQEMEALRTALGDSVKIACDMHWNQTSAEAISKIAEMEPYKLWFAEAPVATEDIKGLSHIARTVKTPVAVGEEWRTVYDAQARIDADAVHIVQPEMGHVGMTQFMRIGLAAQSHNLSIIPHATIGSGIFLAASLQASSALENIKSHEYQHTIFDRNKHLITEGIEVKHGLYSISDKPGLGVEPTEYTISLLKK